MTKVVIITANVLSGLGLLAWPIILFSSAFAWDSPPSRGSVRGTLLEYATQIITWYPLIFGVMLVGSIVLYKSNFHKLGAFVSLSPIFAMCGAFLMFLGSTLR